ncbi:polysaccharide deacetylase [Adhaeribacter arboris]|uniref:Polysaccharide deacetylase n=1 Tax=Adhaeribacter arboris TaxID=2072846 RepID=A0A2T2YES5_9BACT|nr:polysaccharide deacetylase family protein [Adhaeribacter arboris]PSR54009.1 polysaccharide deacetylase [Adhaeribacter arboris]
MRKQIFLLLLLFTIFTFVTQAQNKTLWKGKKSAVVLTYDDGLNTHVNQVIPALDSVGLKGTFYISDYFGGLQTQIPKWRVAAAQGHELANHTIHHPCTGSLPGREFVKPDNDLNNYSVRRMTDEIRTMNTILFAIDGKVKRTFAYPCGDTKIGNTPYLEGLKNDFVGARGVSPAMPTPDKVDLYNISCHLVNGQSGEELIKLVKQAEANQGLLVFLFHGVGGEHSLNVSLKAHRQLLQYLKKREQELWVAPMLDVAEFIKEQQKKS